MKKAIIAGLAMLMLILSTASAMAYYGNYGVQGGYGYGGYGGYGNYGGAYGGYGGHGYGYGNHMLTSGLPMQNLNYGAYVDDNNFLRQTKFRKTLNRMAYQQQMSPYLLVRSPYGKKPWNKPYGDNQVSSLVQNDWNPFFGFPYVRSTQCHNQFACHYHNRFPGN